MLNTKIIKIVINIILTYSNLHIANKVTTRARANIKKNNSQRLIRSFCKEVYLFGYSYVLIDIMVYN